MAVPNTFAGVTTSIPLANLDANFSYYDTAYSISGTTVTYNGIVNITGLTASKVLFTDASKNLTSTGTVAAIQGGTGQTAYAVGDLLYASTTTALNKLADVATGNALISGGVGVAPSWGKVGLATHVSGTLPVANGGTGLTTAPANGALDIGNGTGFTRATLTQGTGISITNAAGSITIAATASGGVTSVTGTSPVASSGGTTPAISLAAGYGDTLNPYASKTANWVLAAPNGAAGVPVFRAIVAADIPTLNQSTTGSAATFTSTTQNSQFNSIGVGTAASGTAGEIRATNNITAYYSDDRLKIKLGNIQGALAKVKTLSGFYYEANQTAQDLGYEPIREVGVSAQQVQAVLPEVVVPAPIDEKYLTVRYEKLIPLLIEAIKELDAKIEGLVKP